MSSSDIAVSVRNLSKSYTITHEQEKHITLAETVLARLKNPLRRPKKETFWALKDVNFDIKKGDVVGIIGRNGAGKSTLLKILSRITEPTAGQIELFGRVGSLLEVGTGFHPELTGRENVFLNGAILGMTKAEVRKQFDAIVDFAGVEKFLDTPVKRYSSGMYVRLAFAVAAHLDSEILIIDEVLAVGDVEFQRRCLGKISSVAKGGRTVLFVSHDLAAVKNLCTQALYLKMGQIVLSGKTSTVVDNYFGSAMSSQKGATFENSKAIIHGFQTINEYGNVSKTLESNNAVTFVIDYTVKVPISAGVSLRVTDARGIVVFDCHESMGSAPERMPGRYQTNLRFLDFPIAPGEYFVDIYLMVHRIGLSLHAERFGSFKVIGGLSSDQSDFQAFDIGGIIVMSPDIQTRELLTTTGVNSK